MKKIILFTLTLLIITTTAFATPTTNSCTITSQSFYVVPKKFNSYENAYEVHCVISGTTNAHSVTINSRGNTSIPEIPVVNGQFSENVIVSYYVSPTPLFNNTTDVTVQAHYNDGTTESFNYQTKTMQVLYNM